MRDRNLEEVQSRQYLVSPSKGGKSWPFVAITIATIAAFFLGWQLHDAQMPLTSPVVPTVQSFDASPTQDIVEAIAARLDPSKTPTVVPSHTLTPRPTLTPAATAKNCVDAKAFEKCVAYVTLTPGPTRTATPVIQLCETSDYSAFAPNTCYKPPDHPWR
jgi:hypothetical protein